MPATWLDFGAELLVIRTMPEAAVGGDAAIERPADCSGRIAVALLALARIEEGTYPESATSLDGGQSAGRIVRSAQVGAGGQRDDYLLGEILRSQRNGDCRLPTWLASWLTS